MVSKLVSAFLKLHWRRIGNICKVYPIMSTSTPSDLLGSSLWWTHFCPKMWHVNMLFCPYCAGSRTSREFFPQSFFLHSSRSWSDLYSALLYCIYTIHYLYCRSRLKKGIGTSLHGGCLYFRFCQKWSKLGTLLQIDANEIEMNEEKSHNFLTVLLGPVFDSA